MFWSCAKSLTNALAGIAVAEGRLAVDASACRYIPALDRGDHRTITIDHLDVMESRNPRDPERTVLVLS